jgi:predicted N-acyltransferase
MQARFHEAISELPASAWDALNPDGNPFLRHAFLSMLETHGCICAETGWQPLHVSLWQDAELLAAMPLYVKSHSYGEFVFDWSWAEASHRIGQPYYPKLLAAVPLTPVVGPRLLVRTDRDLRGQMAEIMKTLTDEHGFSSAHANFVSAEEHADWEAAGLLRRSDWQFHWFNNGFGDFQEFLNQLSSKKRKNIRQERARLAEEGWRFERFPGSEAKQSDWQCMYEFYAGTFARKGNWAVLNRDFFLDLGNQIPESCVLVFGHHEGEVRAGALFFQSANTLYGRYWGCNQYSPGLHFETCYYQGIEYAIERGLECFDPGAQGEHKMARGFVPVATHSFHYLRDPQLRSAVRHWLGREQQYHQLRGTELKTHSPYRNK